MYINMILRALVIVLTKQYYLQLSTGCVKLARGYSSLGKSAVWK